MSKIIVVDDIRLSADKRAVHAINTTEAIKLLCSAMEYGETIDQLWLDYDMSCNHGIGEQTTLPIAEWLLTNQQSRTPLVIHTIYVHSRHTKAKGLVEILNPYFFVEMAVLPDSMWWQQPEETHKTAREETR